MASNSENNNRNKIQEFLNKIDNVPSEEFDHLVNQIHDVLRGASTEGKVKPSEKQTMQMCLDSLVERYLQNSSERVLKILVGLSSPLNEHLFCLLMQKISSLNDVKSRQAVLILISKIVHVTPAWLSQIINHNLLNQFFAILKNDEEVVILGTSALILVEMIATLPSVMCQCLNEIFAFFSRLSTFVYKKKLHSKDANFLHMHSIVYRFFLRLYAMYPCNFVAFLKHTYGLGCSKENGAVFSKMIEPMLSRIRFHPLLITASNEKECDKQRWVYKEAHDHMDDCLQYAIDPIEFFNEANVANELLNTDPFGDDHDDEELCQLTNSTSDEDKMTPTSPVKAFSPQTKLTIEPNSGVIFSQLNENVSQAKGSQIVLLAKQQEEDEAEDEEEAAAAVAAESTDRLIDHFKGKNAEFAEEAILLSKEVSTFDGNNSTQNFPMRSKSVVAPVAIPAVPNLGVIQRKNIGNTTACVSPFKPIKETDNHPVGDMKSLTSKSPANFHSNLSHSLDAKAPPPPPHPNDHDNEDVDMEVVQINLENKSATASEFTKNTSSFSPFAGMEAKLSTQLDTLNLDNDQVAVNELIVNIRKSLKKANSRIRYQSHCLPETDKEFSDFNFSGESPFASIGNLRVSSKSCPILYFKMDDEQSAPAACRSTSTQAKRLSTDGGSIAGSSTNDHATSSRPAAEQNLRTKAFAVSEGAHQSGSKAKINLILENPDAESKQMRRSLSLKKQCKSVDYSKEARQKFQLGKHGFSMDSSGKGNRRDVFESTSSIDIHIPHKADPLHWQFTPHEMLDQMLQLNADLCRKMLQPCSNTENIGSANKSYLPINEDGMRKQLAIMWAQLLFERNQRDHLVIRNRRLYKKLKESLELQEKVSALKDQIHVQSQNQIKLETRLRENVHNFCSYRKNMDETLMKVQRELEECKLKCQQLDNDRSTMEMRYKQEIDSLTANYRTTDLELKKYVTSFDGKNVDLNKLTAENSDLRHKLFVFGEFYTKLRDSYMQNRNVTDLNEKLCLDALKHDNSVLSAQVKELSCKLSACNDRCSNLEVQLKQQEAQAKMRMESQDTQYFKDLLKMKDERIRSLKDVIVNFEKHMNIQNNTRQDASADNAKTA